MATLSRRVAVPAFVFIAMLLVHTEAVTSYIKHIEPTRGNESGGDRVTLFGENLYRSDVSAAKYKCKFDDTLVSAVVPPAPSKTPLQHMVCLSPAADDVPKHVAVTSFIDGKIGKSDLEFFYYESCPNGCSGHLCDEFRRCVCSWPYEGRDCSLVSGWLVVTTSVAGGLIVLVVFLWCFARERDIDPPVGPNKDYAGSVMPHEKSGLVN